MIDAFVLNTVLWLHIIYFQLDQF